MRGVAWLLIFHQFFWLNVFVPAHTRGAVTLPTTGAVAIAKADAPAEVSAVSCCTTKSQADEAGNRAPERKGRCAVCHVVDGYTVPPVYVFDLPLTGRACEAIRAVAAQVAILDFGFPFFPAGPPSR